MCGVILPRVSPLCKVEVLHCRHCAQQGPWATLDSKVSPFTTSVWVRSVADVDSLCSLKEMPLPSCTAVGVQAYRILASSLRRYCVVFGVNLDKLPETLVATQ